MTTHADDLARTRHFLRGDLVELLEEAPLLNSAPAHVQHAWHQRKVDLVRRMDALTIAEAGGQQPGSR